MSNPSPPAPSLRLVHTVPGDLVMVGSLRDATLPAAGATAPLREGEVVQCLRNDPHGVLVARSDGSRALIPPTGARQLAVRWFQGLHDSWEPRALPSPEVEFRG